MLKLDRGREGESGLVHQHLQALQTDATVDSAQEEQVGGADGAVQVRAWQPVRFAHVYGQAEIVDFLLEQVGSRRGGSVLLHGPRGCGKETLARIYASALLCSRPEVDACGHSAPCPECRLVRAEQPSRVSWLEGGISTDEEIAEAIRKQAKTDIKGQDRLVVLVMRAERLSSGASQRLASAMKRPGRAKTFILCAEQLERVRAELREHSALMPLALTPLSVAVRLALLERVCEVSRWRAEPGALERIAGAVGGTPGQLVRATSAAVRDDVVRLSLVPHPGEPGSGAVEAYLSALVEGAPLSVQVRPIEAWTATEAEKVQAIQAVLTGLYRGHLSGFEDGAKGGPGSSPEQAELAQRMTARAVRQGWDAKEFWRACVRLWEPSGAISAHRLFVQLEEFREFCSGSGSRRSSARARSRATAIAAIPERAGRRLGEASPPHLTKEQVIDIWDAAAFMVQTQGVYFNARIFLRYERLGVAQGGIGAFLTALVHELRLRVNRRPDPDRCDGRPAPFHWLHLHEVGQANRVRTHLVLHMPATMTDVEHWIRTKFLATRHLSGARDGGLVYAPPNPTGDGLERHLKLLRLLSRGLDVETCVAHKRIAGRTVRPRLIDLLKVPGRWRGSVGALNGLTRWQASRQIAQGARRRMDTDGLAFVSAMGEGVWEASAKEHDVREWRARQTASQKLCDLQLDYPEADGPAWIAKRSKEEQRIRKAWQADTCERLHSLKTNDN